MSWELWVCVVAVGGTCAVERASPMPSWTTCSTALRAVRVEPSASAAVSANQANVVEIHMQRPYVVAYCATAPASSASR